MLAYLIKRVVLTIPVVFLITLLIFALGEFVPGDAIISNMPGSQDFITNTSLDSDERESLYRDLRKKYNLDLPVFYFSVHSLAEPDSLHLIYPLQHRDYLTKMVFVYGNWPAIYDYYQSAYDLWKNNLAFTRSNNLEALFTALFEKTAKEDIEEIMISLEKLTADNLDWKENLGILKRKYQNLETNRQPYKNYIPVIHFHGGDNKYHKWVESIFGGDWGRSFQDDQKVKKRIGVALYNTLIITTISLICIFLIAILLGAYLSFSNSLLKKIILPLLFGFDAVPLFWIALLCITFFASSEYWQLFPAFGLRSEAWLAHAFLPVFCIVITGVPYVTRQVQATMDEVNRQYYIVAARAKGASQWRIIRYHVLRNSLLPVITLFVAYLPGVVSGVLVIEYIFSIPGVGKLMIDALFARDYPVILGIVTLVSFVKVTANILGDVAYYYADPRIRYN